MKAPSQVGASRRLVIRSATVVSLLGAAAMAAATDDRASLAGRVNELLGLHACEIVSLNAEPLPDARQQIMLLGDGTDWTLDLQPHWVRSPDYRLKVQVEGGKLIEVEPSPPQTVRGEILEVPGSRVAASVMDGGLYARISLPTGDVHWIEPLVGRLPGAAPGDYALYHEADVIPAGGTCGTTHAQEAAMLAQSARSAQGNVCLGSVCVAELACDADVEYFQRYGSVEAVENRINAVINAVNSQYEEEVGITHEITAIIVRTSEPDPYSSFDSNTLLTQFRTEWLNNQLDISRDLAKLFTGKDIQTPLAGIIGQAWTIGAVCTTNAYCYSQSDCCGTFACTTDLAAHELGHLWGAVHCSCPTFTMNPNITCTNHFASSSISLIIGHRNTRNCLSDLAPVAALPFQDSFADTTFDPTKWLAEGPTIDDMGNGEPSPPYSARINDGDRLTSGILDAAGSCIVLSYAWQRAGSLGSVGAPEPGEDLLVEYRSASGFWQIVARHLGDGPITDPYFQEAISLPADAGHSGLQIRFSTPGAESADNFFVDDVQVSTVVPVAITSHPLPAFSCVGGGAVFNVSASGEGNLTYRWTRDGQPLQDGGSIQGATTTQLVVSPITPGDIGLYRAEVSNICSSAQSQSAELVDSGLPSIGVQPLGAAVPLGQAFIAFVQATAAESYQWFKDGEPVAGAEMFYLQIPAVECADAGLYHADMTNGCGISSSTDAELIVDDPSCSSGPAPFIVHTLGLPGQTRPYSGYVDPRLESNNGSNVNLGISQITVVFSEPVRGAGGAALSAADFAVAVTGGTAPVVQSVDASANPVVVLQLNGIIPLKEWTTIRAAVENMRGVAIDNAGDLGPGVHEPDRIDLAFLPGDVDQSGSVTPLDLLRYRQMLAGVLVPPLGTAADYIDTDRNGTVNPTDLLRYRQILFGSGTATQAWTGEDIGHAQP